MSVHIETFPADSSSGQVSTTAQTLILCFVMISSAFDGTCGGHVPCGGTAHINRGGLLQSEYPEAARCRPAPFQSISTSFSEGLIMSFAIYGIGFAILIGGLIYGAYLLHVPAHWIVVGAVVLLGIGILTGVKATRQKDPVG